MKLVRNVIVFDAADLAAESSFWAGIFGGYVFEDEAWHSVVDADGEWRIEAVTGGGLVLGEDARVHGVGAGGGRREVPRLGGDVQGRVGGQARGQQGLRLAGGGVGGGVDPLRAEGAARAAASGITWHR
ncbi:hypothetical protein [Streptomyces mirabilis]|uniref:hypothetical protein n=1 Tax=Streptomyces mirabilis TaxID=68239 RepID=UPI0036A24546